MKDREFEGHDLAEALREASRALGIPDPDIDYRIVEQGRRGLFGVGARAVRIRVLPPLEPAPDPLADTDLRLDPDPDPAEPAGPAEPDAAPTPGTPDPRPRSRPARRGASGEAAAAGPAPEVPDEGEANEEGAEAIRAQLGRILELGGFELRARVSRAGGEVRVDLDGPDRRLLQQKDAELARAFEFLLNRMARRTWPGVGRIVVLRGESEHGRRDEELVAMAHAAATEVRRTGRPQRLPPLNAYERRIVHLTVRAYDHLDSRTEGQGPVKRVRVVRRSD